MDRLKLGNEGEARGVRFLKRNGYKILCRNFRAYTGEIDIIAEHNREIVFVEVKTRSSLNYGYPEESVTYWKTARIVKTSQYYLLKHKIEKPYRFEILSVFVDDNRRFSFKIVPIET